MSLPLVLLIQSLAVSLVQYCEFLLDISIGFGKVASRNYDVNDIPGSFGLIMAFWRTDRRKFLLLVLCLIAGAVLAAGSQPCE